MTTRDTTHLEAPGPGFWRRDDSHMPDPVTRYMRTAFVPKMTEGFALGLARYGALLAGFDFDFVAGRGYMRARPVGAPPPKAGKTAAPPPPFVLKLLFLLHPEMRRRNRRAGETFESKRWRADLETWRREVSPQMRRTNVALQAEDPAALDLPALRAHVARATDALRRGAVVHFANIPAYVVPVGDFLHHACEWTGAPPRDALRALKGASPASAATLLGLDRLVEAVRQSPGAAAILSETGGAAARLARLRAASAGIAEALDAYLGEHGHRIATGFDLADMTLVELPQLLLSSIAARDVANDAEGASETDALRDRVPADRRAEYDALLAEARALHGLRDEDVGITCAWPTGLVRRALLAAGQKLGLRRPEDAFDTTPDEMDALLGGGGPRPSVETIAMRADERAALARLDPPFSFGVEEGPPPADALPPASARMMRAVGAYVSLLERDGVAKTRPAASQLSGHAVSGGRYEGPARVVHGPRDFEKIGRGDVLVARMTSPVYNVVLPLLGAVVTDRGGALCHTAIVAREFGIPGVVGTGDATVRIPDGARIVVDGDAGTVEIRV